MLNRSVNLKADLYHTLFIGFIHPVNSGKLGNYLFWDPMLQGKSQYILTDRMIWFVNML